ncbi:hypothetical protein GQ457_07G014090 [Hibiscus cannabinus]
MDVGGPKPFKWFSHWADSAELMDLVKAETSKSELKDVGSTLKSIKGVVKVWVKKAREADSESTGNLEKKIAALEEYMCAVGCNKAMLSELQRFQTLLWNKYRREEREWLQKSRLKWFSEGDRNTKFFHLSATLRKNRNKILSVKVDNTVLEDQSCISYAFEEHFRQSFNSSSTIPVKGFRGAFKSLPVEVANALEAPFTEGEIWGAIQSADGNKAPGPDGFNLDFYKKMWPLLKDKVLKFFREFYKGRIKDKSFNHSFITLIPKVTNPKCIDDYRPISLVSSLYKILARVLSRRLSGCLNLVIGDTQFAFVPRKQIVDCSLLANELIDDFKKRKQAAIMFKADFRKAYDTMNWSFLDFIRRTMGFGVLWRKWIQMCLESATISVLVNGTPSNRFGISRGLRQGCPLSPMLFNIIGEALSVLIHNAIDQNLLEGVDVGVHGLSVSHLQFADDLIIFGNARLESVRNIKRVLRIFEVASGLSLNLHKTKLYGINVDDQVLQDWASIIGCSSDVLPTSYLGLPLGYPRNSLALWKPIIDKLSLRLAGWKGKCLSLAGRITLAKSVLSNLPVYFLSLFQLPSKVADILNSAIAKFIWGPEKTRPIHWVKWESICRPKSSGGLGIVDLKVKNRSLLNKWVVRFGSEQNQLWHRVIVDKYGLDRTSLLPTGYNNTRSSWLWKNIACPLENQSNMLTQNLRLELRDGNRINFWEDFWTEVPSLKDAFPRMFSVAVKKCGKVVEFGCKADGVWSWNIELRRPLFTWEREVWDSFRSTLDCATKGLCSSDALVWKADVSGIYNPKSFCLITSSQGANTEIVWNLIWQNIAPPKVEAFLWRAILGRIPTLSELAKRGVSVQNSGFEAFEQTSVENGFLRYRMDYLVVQK